jgi:hypothetical protein
MLYKNDGRVPCRIKSPNGGVWILRPTESVELDEDLPTPGFITKTQKRAAWKPVEKVEEAAKVEKATKKSSKTVWKRKKSFTDKDEPKTTKE